MEEGVLNRQELRKAGKRDPQGLLRYKDGKPLKAKSGMKFIPPLFSELEVLTHWVSPSRHSGRHGAGVAASSQLRVRPPPLPGLCTSLLCLRLLHYPTSFHSPSTATVLDLGKVVWKPQKR